VRAIVFDAFQTLDSARKSHMSPFPTVFALGHPWVHICSLDCCNVFTNIKTSIDEHLGIAPALNIPDINLHDKHVRLRQHLDDSRFGC